MLLNMGQSQVVREDIADKPKFAWLSMPCLLTLATSTYRMHAAGTTIDVSTRGGLSTAMFG